MGRNWSRIIFAVVFFITVSASAQDFPVRAGPGSGISFSTNGNNVRGRWDQAGALQCFNDLSLREPGGPDFVTLSSPALSSSWTLTLPSGPGNNLEFLQTNGSGVTSWAPAPASIQSLNTQTGSTQTLVTGTSGTDFNISSATDIHTFNLPTASATNSGKLLSSDWSKFDGKQDAGNYITALTGDVTATGPGSVSATIANNAVSNAKFRQSVALSVVGNSTNASANVDDIVASTDHHVFRRSGTALGFGLLNNDNVDAGAAIARSKIAAGSANHVVINDGSGLFSSEATLAVTRGGIQKSSWTIGTLLLGNGTSAPNELSGSSAGHVVQWNGSAWVSAAPPSSGVDVFGTRTSPRAIVAGTGITSGAGHMSTTSPSQKIYVEGSGGPVNISANPQIEAGTVDGQLMTICGRSNTNTVELDHGDGLDLNGMAVLGLNECITLSWDTSDWVELSRNN